MTLARPVGPHPSGEETSKERLDRNFDELLQEMRVAQTGVQILLAFLLTLAFSSRFSVLNGQQLALYAVSVCLSTIAMGLLVAPVALHRVLFRRQMKAALVHLTHRLTAAGLVAMLAGVCSAVLLALEVAVGTAWALTLTTALGVAIFGLWFGVPLAMRRGDDYEDAQLP